MSAKRKPLTSLARPVIKQSAKVPAKSKIDESRAAVTTGLASKASAAHATETIEISSDSSSGEGSDAESEDEHTTATTQISKASKVPRQKAAGKPKMDQDSEDAEDQDVEMTSPQPEDGQDQGDVSDTEEPTFGDLIRGSTNVDVSSALAAQTSSAVARPPATPRSVAPTTSTSLGTVLNQALKTNDAELLESCLQVNDVNIIQNTINRMDSGLAGTLLFKLAARMHRRPGRAFGLMKWMQWTMIAHGGTLVTQPDVVNKLGDLQRVLEERARGLPSLLALKGKLDMLDAQMKFRKSIKGDPDQFGDDSEEDVDEPGVIYVEGEETQPKALTNGTAAMRIAAGEDDDFPLTNGINEDSDDESENGDDDDQAEASEVESLDEDEVDHDDVEESGEDDDEEDEDAAPPSKVQKVSTKFASRK